MGRFIFFLVALIAVVIATLIFIPGVVPVATYKDRLEAEASKSIGRDISFGDDLSLKILPRTAFRVSNLTIANAEGFGDAPLAQVGEADIGVNVLALLSGAVEVDRFVLVEPEINLVKKADGSVNWNLAGSDAPSDGGDASVPSVRDLSLGDIRIVDGQLNLRDDGENKTWSASDIDINVVLRSLKEPLEVNGGFQYEGQAATIDLVLTTLENLQKNEPANLKYNFAIGETTTSGDLNLETGDALRYAGPIQFNAPNLPAFASIAGAELADAPGFDQLSFSGNVDGSENAMRLSGANINFDAIAATGALTLNWAGSRAKASGALNAETLDLRPYLPEPSTTPTTTSEGFPAWSTDTLDFTSLRNVDADFDLTTQSIYFNGLKIDETQLKLQINNGRLSAEAPVLAMYGGQGSGRLVVNARQATPSFAGSIDMSALNAHCLLYTSPSPRDRTRSRMPSSA